MEFEVTSIQGLYLLHNRQLTDERGTFCKTYQYEQFAKKGLLTDFREEFYSRSHTGVLRGMHFQLPPHAHRKVVYCVQGRVLDVILDLRTDSSGFGNFQSFELSPSNGRCLFIPQGCAHGFWALEESIMMYKVETAFSPDHDAGILWSSFGFEWPGRNPVLSTRDGQHESLEGFRSPF